MNDLSFKRRDFLQGGSAAALAMLFGGARVYAEEVPQPVDKKPAPGTMTTACAVIGLGDQGRATLSALANLPVAEVKYVCDHYENAHKRALELAPKAAAATEYKKVLDDKAVQAVWIATPTHKHKQIALDAIQAGKHVYCEAPLSNSIDEAREIAKAALAGKVKFQVGLQERGNPQHVHVLGFVKTGALGKVSQVRAHWHKRTSWRRAAPTDDRQRELNWRLSKETSAGLVAESGIHHLDTATWFLKNTPLSVSGFGEIIAWDDGRDVADTVQCVLQFPNKISMMFDATLANSYDGSAEIFQGTAAATLLRDQRAWMFKEVDARSLGWEVYAFKEKVGDDTGIALVADATKILDAGGEPAENRTIDPKKNTLYHSCDAFLTSIREDKKVACGALDGFKATVIALKANEAIVTGKKIEFQKEWFEV